MEINKLYNGAIVIEPKIFYDERGYFFESFNEEQFNRETGMNFHPVQDNESKSSKGVFRGLHFQKPPYAQAKLVRVVQGAVYDFAVDIREGSPTYGKWSGVLLTEENHRQFFVPRGYAHGFIALSDNTIFQYKCDNYYCKESEGAVSYLDETIENPEIKLSIIEAAVCNLENRKDLLVSEKDKLNKNLSEINNPFVYETNEKYEVGDRVHWESDNSDMNGESEIVKIYNVLRPDDFESVTIYIINIEGVGNRAIKEEEIKYKINK